MDFFLILALWGSLCHGLVTYVGFPANITTTCFTPFSFNMGPFFPQTCPTNNCGTVLLNLSPDLSIYGLRWDTDSTYIGGTTNTLAAETSLLYTINTTVTASDADGSASGLLLLHVLCPLSAGVIAPQLATSHTYFAIDLTPYVTNPLPDVPLVWAIQGLPAGSGYTLSPNGTFSGNGTAADTRYFATSQTLVPTVNYYSGDARNAVSLALPLTVVPVGPSLLSAIPDQFLTEGVAYSQNFATYFQDPDGLPLTYTIRAFPANLSSTLTFSPTQATIVGTPGADAVGVWPAITICANEVQIPANAVCSSFQITVAPRARIGPVCTYPNPLTQRVGDPLSLDFNAYCRSPSGAVPLTYTQDLSWPPQSGLALDSTGLLQGVVTAYDANQSQPLRLVVTVTDTDGLSTQTGLQLTVLAVNHPPHTTVYANIAQFATEHFPWNYSVVPWFTDPDGDSLTYQITPGFDSRSAIRFDVLTGLFYGTPNAYDVTQRQYVWSITADDGKGGISDVATMTLTILPDNCPATSPVPLTAPPAYLGVPWSFDLRPYFTTANGDVLTFTISNPVVGSGLMLSNGVLTANWTPADVAASELNSARITITASNANNCSITNYLFYSVTRPPTCSVPTIPTGYLTGTGACTTPGYQLDISRFCTSNYPITYAFQPPRPQALTLSSSGLLLGNITQTDANLGRVDITVNATGSRGGSTVFTFSIPVQQLYALQQRPCDAQQTQTCYQGYGCLFQIKPCFVASGLCFEIINSTQSSLAIGPTSGVVTGSVTDADIAQPQPIILTIRAWDQTGGVGIFRLAVRMLRASQLMFKPITDQTISCGQQCCPLSPVDFILNPSGNLSFTLEYGLPSRSQITLNPVTGRFSGIASLVDVQASPLTLSIVVDNQLPTGPVRMPPLAVTVLGKAAVATIPTITVPSTTVKVATPVVYAASQLFRNVDSETTFTLTTPGLRSLVIDPRTGVITGTVTSQEFVLNTSATSGIMPVMITIAANNSGSCGGGIAQANLLLLVDPQLGAPIPGNYPLAIIFCENKVLSFNFGAYFTDPRQNPMTFTIQGLPVNTTLSWDPLRGVLTGIPNASDFAASPVSAVICAQNVISARACINIQLSFLRGQRPPVIDPPIPSPVTAIVGQSFSGFFSRHFSDANNQPLIYSVSGLPIGSGMGIGPITGIFSGTPNEADFRASPLVLTVFATNEQNVVPNNCSGTGGRARADFLMVITKNFGPPTCGPIANPYDPPSVGQFWLLDVSRSVHDSQKLKLEYALRGLPRDSGLSIDPQYGILSGLITDADFKAQPVAVTIAVTNGYGECISQLILAIRPRPQVSSSPNCPSCSVSNGGCQHRCAESGRPCAPTCSCNVGFALQADGRTCSPTSPPAGSLLVVPVPVPGSNPCGSNNGGCSQLCTGNGNIPVCSCRDSYALGPDGRSCNYDACSLNNGGCEQLCVSGTAKCGCQQGTLNADGRTCATDLILVGTIPPALVIGCQHFLFDFSTAFRYQGNSPSTLAFSMSGLPQQTGFTLASNGMMSGTPSAADCGQKQPMVLSVSATDQKGSLVRAVMFLSAFCQISACGGRQPQLPASSSTAPSVVPDVWATVGQRTRFDASKYFPSSDLSYYCLGLPSGSGLWMSQDGVLDGIPNKQDCDNSLLGLTVVGRDKQAREYKAILSIKFNTCQSPRDLWPSQFTNRFPSDPTPTISSTSSSNQPYAIRISPALQKQSPAQFQAPSQFQSQTQIFPANQQPFSSSAPLSDAAWATFTRTFASPQDANNMNIQTSAQCGKPFFYNVKDLFPVNGLSFSIVGLPLNTGFQISDGGVLTGSPTLVDKTASPLIGNVTAVDSYGSFKTLTMRITVVGFCVSQSNLNALILPTQYATAGEPFVLDLSRISLSRCANATYALSGLLPSSGLKMSSIGVLSGTPVKDECKANDLRLVTTCAAKQTGGGTFQLVVACPGSNASAPILNGQLPPATGISGQFFYYNAAPYLSSSNGPLTFSQSGSTKNLIMSRTGALSGFPSEADAGVITITAVDGRGTQIQADLNFRAVLPSNSSMLTFFPMNTVQAFEGNGFSLDFSQRFFPSDAHTTYTIQGLRPGSGLSFDDTTGMLSGVPNEVDVRQTQPIRLTVVATLNQDQSARGVVGVSVVPSTPLLAPKGYSNSARGTSLISIPIPPQTAAQGEPFLLGVASSFFDQTRAAMTYSLTGVAAGSGLSIDPSNGVISGNPTRADANALQPLSLTISAANCNGDHTSQILKLTVFQPKQQAPNRPPVVDVIPNASAVVGQGFILTISQYFDDPDGDSLTYSISGLPAKSGLKIESTSGIISGQATDADVKASPMQLVVLAGDGLGGMTQAAFTLKVYQRARGVTNNAPMSSAMPHKVANVGDNFSFSARDYFTDSDGDKLTFRVFGLPDGSGLIFDSATGYLSGSPSAADAKVKQPLVVGFEADDGHDGRVGNILYLDIKSGVQYRSFKVVDDVLANISGTSSVPTVAMQTGVWTMFQTSRYFPFYQSSNNVTYVIAGLPVSSGLNFNQNSGVLSGFPTDTTHLASNVPITVNAQYYYNTSLVNKLQQPLVLRFVSANDQKHNSAPIVRSSILDVRMNSDDDLLLNTGSSFTDPDGDALTFSVLGLPPNSGLMIVPSSGILFGTPSQEDVQAGSMLLTIVADDSYGHRIQESFFLTVAVSDNQPQDAQTTTSAKTCGDLGWLLVSPATVCAQSPKFASMGCSTLVNYTQARTLCVSIGARLCSSLELLDSHNVTSSSACTSKGGQMDPMWTSSTCAFNGTVITLSESEKNCSSVLTDYAKVKCCADKIGRPKVKGSRLALSVKSCEQLSQFAVTPFAVNTAVCTYVPRKGVKCANSANFTEARRKCEELGARLCTTTEILENAAVNAGCGIRGRIWTGIPCANSSSSSLLGGASFTQGGTSSSSNAFPPQCTQWNKTLPFVCCADFTPSTAFSTTRVDVNERTLTLEWEWGAYSKVSVSHQIQGATRSSQWQGTQEVDMRQGKGSYTISKAQSASGYALRLIPVVGRKLYSKQAAFVDVNTTMSTN